MDWRWRSSDQYVADPKRQGQRAAKQMDVIESLVAGPQKLLDFGAGSGALVEEAAYRGWNALGVERSEAAIERAHHRGVALQRDLPDEEVDVLTLMDVIEHVRDLDAVLGPLVARLRKGGRVFFETGNWENWRRIADSHEWGLFLLDHHFYFSPHSLNLVTMGLGLRNFEVVTNYGSQRPTRNPRAVLRAPRRSAREWGAYMAAKRRWPTHGDKNVMMVTATKG